MTKQRDRLRIPGNSAGALALWLAVLPFIGGVGADEVVESQAPQGKARQTKAARLIEQLGSTQYAARQHAQRELEAMGLDAFDALHQARDHDDIEIAMRARFLVRSMRISWSQEGDSSQVRSILKNYGRRSIPDRRNRMERLAQLDEFDGLKALCRLVRYESDSRLSKRAALLVMGVEGLNSEEHKQKLAKIVNDTIGESKRASARWLLTFAKTLQYQEKTLSNWAQISQDERLTLSQFPAQSSRHLLRDLLRWRAKLLQEVGKADEYTTVVRQTMRLLDGTESELHEMVGWLMDRKAWPMVEDLSKQFSSEFSRNSMLLYRLAETREKMGNQERAAQTAKEALAISPGDPTSHVATAYALKERGLLKWSIDEFHHVIKTTKPGTSQNLYSRLLVSEVLHDIDRDLEAGEALKGIIAVLDRPEVVRYLVERRSRSPDGIRSRMNYFFALDKIRRDRKQARAFLEAGLAKDQYDPDILIAMHGFDGGDEWKQQTKKRIEAAIEHFRADIKTHRIGIVEATDDNSKINHQLRLAFADNNMAWLISNTIGDINEAIRCSHESIKMRPNTSAYLDTLGRCYYTKGDYVNAVKYQKEAVQLEPSSATIRRQLTLFEKALQESLEKKKKKKTD